MLGQNTKSFLTVKVLPSDIRQSPVSDDQMRKFWLVVHRVESLGFNLNFIRHLVRVLQRYRRGRGSGFPASLKSFFRNFLATQLHKLRF